MHFSKCRLKFDVVSAFSFVHDYNTFVYERLLSAHVGNVARVALSRTYSGWWASCSAQRYCREWATFSAQFWTSGIHFFGTASIVTLARRADSVVGCGELSFISMLQYQRARSHVLLLWTATSFTQQGSRAQI